MKLKFVEPKKGKGRFTIERLKVYKKGNLNLTKNLLEVLGLDYGGGDVIAEADPVNKRILLRPALKMGEFPSVSLKSFERDEVYILRGAFREAEDFFQELKEALQEVFPEADLEVGNLDENGLVYLKLGPRPVFQEIHLAYRESPSKPKGLITLNGGIQGVDKSSETAFAIEENLKLITQLVNGKLIGSSGISLLEAPYFNRKEMAQVVLKLSPLLKEIFSKERVAG